MFNFHSSKRKRYNRKRNAYQKIPGFTKRTKSTKGSKKIILWSVFIFFMIPVVIGASWFWKNILQDLPDIAEIENFNFKQATTITDRHGDVLYTLFEENRQYVSYEDISSTFINALIATEDQRFWTNPGIDRKGTIRAGITDITKGKSHGASTITQQLIKNLMLTPEKKITRKLKEIVLAMKLNTYISGNIKKKYKNLSSSEIEKKMKEKILELYSNYIFLGNNAYGIEVASQNYFNKSAKELNILEGAILAGIPQAPSRYDPYNNRSSLMGEITTTDKNGTPVDMTEDLFKKIFTKITESIEKTSLKKDDTAIIGYLKGRLSFSLPYQGETYQINYLPGRKDSVLAREYEEGYITETEFKKSFLDGFTYDFKRGTVKIKAPHFVFWVINMLEKNYDQEMLRKGGLTITTTLDSSIQKLAQESITENEDRLTSYKVNNAAMIYTNSQNGDVLAYVGSKDYYNKEIDGEVDIIQAKRQPGSIIKPFVYALGFMKLALTVDSPIYDIPLTIGKDKPNNSDGKFWGLTNLKNALAGSRNIPAIKMFFAIGGEKPLKKLLKSIGITNLKDDVLYGYPLSIGAGEIPMIEMTNAYMHLSAMGKPAEINPISEIRSSDGSLLYKKQVKTQKQVIPAGVAYLIWNILSTKTNFPSGRQKTFTYKGINFATKSGTTNVKKGKESLPRDGWFAAYTPSNVMIFWGGNTDGSPLRGDAYGGRINSPIWKTFTKKLETNGFIENQTVSEREVSSVSISKITGKLSSYVTPIAFVKKSLGYINTLPTEVDNNVRQIKIDSLCDGKSSELTPTEDKKNAYVIAPMTILPDKRDQGNVIARWRNYGLSQYSAHVGKRLFLKAPEKECEERYAIAELGEISLTIMQPKKGETISRDFSLRHQTKSPFTIKTIKLYLNNIELKPLKYNKKGALTDISTIHIPAEVSPGSYTLKVVAFDEKGYSDSQSIPVHVIDSSQDTTPPYFLKNKVKVIKKDTGGYDIVLLFGDDNSTIASGNISQGGKTIFNIKSNVAMFHITTLDTLNFTVADSAGNMTQGNITPTYKEKTIPKEPTKDIKKETNKNTKKNTK